MTTTQETLIKVEVRSPDNDSFQFQLGIRTSKGGAMVVFNEYECMGTVIEKLKEFTHMLESSVVQRAKGGKA